MLFKQILFFLCYMLFCVAACFCAWVDFMPWYIGLVAGVVNFSFFWFGAKYLKISLFPQNDIKL